MFAAFRGLGVSLGGQANEVKGCVCVQDNVSSFPSPLTSPKSVLESSFIHHTGLHTTRIC